MVIFSFVIEYAAIKSIVQSNQYTEAKCLIIDYESVECDTSGVSFDGWSCYKANQCDYSCGTDNDMTCYGKRYQYYATSESVCGSKILTSMAWEDDCSDQTTLKEPGSKHTCYIIDCKTREYGEFSWLAPQFDLVWSFIFMVFGICCPCCCCCGMIKQYTDYEHGGEWHRKVSDHVDW